MLKTIGIKKIIFLGFLSLALFSLGIAWGQTTVRPKVVSSFSIIDDLVRNIGGDKIEAQLLIPNGFEVHEFEPRPHQLRLLFEAQGFIFIGPGFEKWWGHLKAQLAAKSTVQILELNKNINSAQMNPHAWLDPRHLKTYVSSIRDFLGILDPTHLDYFANRAQTLIQKMEHLEAKYSTLKNLPSKISIITPHDGLYYLAEYLGMAYYFINSGDSHNELSALKLKEWVERVKKLKSTGTVLLFDEDSSSTKLLQTLAQESQIPLSGKVRIESLSDNTSDGVLGLLEENFKQIEKALKKTTVGHPFK